MKIYGRPEKSIGQAVASGDVTIAVYGLGKMGSPLASVFEDAGARVIGADIDEGVVATINQGICHVTGEPGLSDLGSGVAINEIDAILIASDHAGFKEIDWGLLDRRMLHEVVVDGRGIIDPEELRLRGYLYRAVGQS